MLDLAVGRRRDLPRRLLHARGRALKVAVRRELTLARRPGEHAPAHVSAASGLVASGAWLYIAVDDELGLAVFPRAGDAPGRLLRLPGEALPPDPVERKRRKPDLEALCVLPGGGDAPHGTLLALGSGSAAPRRAGVRWALDRAGALRGEPQPVDLAPLYDALGREFAQLNIEGATVRGDELLLAQRGNSAEGLNAIVTLDLAGGLVPEAIRTIERHDLPELSGVATSFTDLAALPDGRLVYLACAEATDDPIRDGEFVGAVAGVLGGEASVLEPAAKVEGVWPVSVAGGAVELLLVADPDDRAVPAPLLAGTLAA